MFPFVGLEINVARETGMFGESFVKFRLVFAWYLEQRQWALGLPVKNKLEPLPY